MLQILSQSAAPVAEPGTALPGENGALVSWRAEPAAPPARTGEDLLSKAEIDLFLSGTHFHAYKTLGAHVVTVEGESGTLFAVWTPNAERVQVIGDFNGWDTRDHSLRTTGLSGIWFGFAPGIGPGTRYKFYVVSKHRGFAADKADPFAFCCERPPGTASIVWNLDYAWGDQDWMERRDYRVGAPRGGYWRELVNSNAQCYAGSGQGNAGGVQAEPAPWHGRPFSLKLVLPPLAALFFAHGRGAPAAPGTPA